jgi:hypothetical protein
MADAIMRCKMRVNWVKQSMSAEGKVESEEISLQAVYGPEGSENARWSRWTPSAQFSITVNNPEAFGRLSKGGEYFVDFIPVEKAA